MGYELAIRARSAETAFNDRALIERLAAAVTQGLAAAAGDQPAPAPAPASPEPGSPSDAVAPAPPGPWTLANGKGAVHARLFRRDDAVRGVDLDIPFGGTEEEFRRFFSFAMDLGAALDSAVFDPQLGRELARTSVDEVVTRWRESQAWMVDVAGAYEDPRGMVDLRPPPPLVTPRNKVLLLLAGGAMLLYVVVGALADLFGE